MQRMPCRVAGLTAAILMLGALSGCASTKSTAAKTLIDDSTQRALDLSDYDRATVMTFDTEGAKGKKLTPAIASAFSDDLARRLRNDFGPLFAEVRRGEPENLADELVISGRISKYKPGSRFGRSMLIGLGAAHLEAVLILRDGGTRAELLRAPVDKLWAWGGIVGASKGIKEMGGETVAMMAATVARARGWTPEGGVVEGPAAARAPATKAPTESETAELEEIVSLTAAAERAAREAPEQAAEVEVDSKPEVEEVAKAEAEAEEAAQVKAVEAAASEVTPAAQVAAAVEPDPPGVTMCYLGLEFVSETLRATTVRVDVDGKMMALVGAGDKTVVRFTEGMHDVSVALPKASKKKRKKNMFAVELKPFVYTKIMIEEVEGKKSKNRLIVRVLEDGEVLRTHTIEL